MCVCVYSWVCEFKYLCLKLRFVCACAHENVYVHVYGHTYDYADYHAQTYVSTCVACPASKRVKRMHHDARVYAHFPMLILKHKCQNQRGTCACGTCVYNQQSCVVKRFAAFFFQAQALTQHGLTLRHARFAGIFGKMELEGTKYFATFQQFHG